MIDKPRASQRGAQDKKGICLKCLPAYVTGYPNKTMEKFPTMGLCMVCGLKGLVFVEERENG